MYTHMDTYVHKYICIYTCVRHMHPFVHNNHLGVSTAKKQDPNYPNTTAGAHVFPDVAVWGR